MQGGEDDRWSARRLMEQMAYDNWQNFEQVIERAKQAAEEARQVIDGGHDAARSRCSR
jgi:hypothetical protein